MTDPLTAADLYAIEQDRLGKPRLGRSIARETDLDLLAIRRLLAEVRRLRAMEQRVSKVARELRYKNADTYDIVGRFLVALDGGE